MTWMFRQVSRISLQCSNTGLSGNSLALRHTTTAAHFGSLPNVYDTHKGLSTTVLRLRSLATIRTQSSYSPLRQSESLSFRSEQRDAPFFSRSGLSLSERIRRRVGLGDVRHYASLARASGQKQTGPRNETKAEIPNKPKVKRRYDLKYAFYFLLFINTAVFVAWQLADQSWMRLLFCSSYIHLRAGLYWTTLTSSISQESFVHYFGNMLSLLLASIVYRNSSLKFGAGRFVAFYFAAGAGASLFSCWLRKWWDEERKRRGESIDVGFSHGASGPLYAFFSYYTMAFPKQSVNGLLPFLLIPRIPFQIPLWAVFFAVMVFETQQLRVDQHESKVRVNNAAHIGGALFGVAAFLLTRRRPSGVLGLWKKK